MGLVILIISHWKREAEIFAGIVLLPNAEIQNGWQHMMILCVPM